MGPDRQSDAYPLTDRGEVRTVRYWLDGGREAPAFGHLIDLGPEQFATHEDYMAARELDEWGCNPFEEE